MTKMISCEGLHDLRLVDIYFGTPRGYEHGRLFVANFRVERSDRLAIGTEVSNVFPIRYIFAEENLRDLALATRSEAVRDFVDRHYKEWQVKRDGPDVTEKFDARVRVRVHKVPLRSGGTVDRCEWTSIADGVDR